MISAGIYAVVVYTDLCGSRHRRSSDSTCTVRSNSDVPESFVRCPASQIVNGSRLKQEKKTITTISGYENRPISCPSVIILNEILQSADKINSVYSLTLPGLHSAVRWQNYPCIFTSSKGQSFWRTVQHVTGFNLIGAFVQLRRATITFAMSIRLPVLTKQFGSHWTDFYEIWHLSIFRKSVAKIQVLLISYKNNGYFTWRPKYIFDHISLKSSQNENCFRQKL